MVETSTIPRVNNRPLEEHSMELFGEQFQFDQWVTDIARQNTANRSLNDNIGRRYIRTRLMTEDDFWNNREIDESLVQVSGKHDFVVVIGRPWYRMPNSPGSTEQSSVEGSMTATNNASRLSYGRASNSIPLKTEWNIRPKGSLPKHCDPQRTNGFLTGSRLLHGRLAAELRRIGPAVLGPP